MSVYITKKSPAVSKLDWIQGDGLERGMHKQAESEGKSLTEFLEDVKTIKRSEPSPYVGMSQLEIAKKRMFDKTSPLTAVEEYFQAAGIDLHRASLKALFDFSDISVIVPEYFKNQVCVGLLKAGYLEKIIMSSTDIGTNNYHKIYLDSIESERQLRNVGVGEPFPRTRMSVSEQSVILKKYARLIEIPDEVKKEQRLPLVAAVFQLIGQELDLSRTGQAIYTIINGDGNSNTPDKTMTETITDTRHILEFWEKLDVPYQINVAIFHLAEILDYRNTLLGLSNPLGQMSYIQANRPVELKWDNTDDMAANRVLGIDSRYCLEEVTDGGVQTENDRIIDGQLNQTTISFSCGYSVYDKKAACLWTVST